MSIKAVAVLVGETVKGFINFEQEGIDSPVRIYGEIKNLSKGLHGFHIHEFGDTTNGCASAGDHFNPTKKTHGAPDVEERHVGDLGNINSNEEGVAKFDMTDRVIRLNGPHSIIGRCIVVHQDQDDLGLGGTELSKTTGNSGARIGCGVIGIRNA